MKFWAICDTDGGRHEPRPMARCIFTTEDAALSHRAYQGYPPLYYPIRQIDGSSVMRWSTMISRNHTGHRIGESHGRAKVPDEVVRQAREMNEQGIGYVRISKALSVPVSTVANWCQYRTRWSA